MMRVAGEMVKRGQLAIEKLDRDVAGEMGRGVFAHWAQADMAYIEQEFGQADKYFPQEGGEDESENP
jgi:hypothetical protein